MLEAQVNHEPTGNESIMYECENGCLFSKDMITVLRLEYVKIQRCPYCNSENIKQA